MRMKVELRRSMLALRGAVPKAAQAARSARVCESVRALDAFRTARTIASYVATRGECDPSALVQTAWSRDTGVVLPRVVPGTKALVWARYTSMTPLAPGAFGIPAPSEGEGVDATAIDLVLVPCVAVDERGNRIGMGKGFYDRALATLPNAMRVGIAFHFQLVGEIPAEAHDVPLDWIVTDERTIAIAR